MKPAILRSASDDLIFVCRNRDDSFSFLWLKVSTVVSNGSREMNLFDPFIHSRACYGQPLTLQKDVLLSNDSKIELRVEESRYTHDCIKEVLWVFTGTCLTIIVSYDIVIL